MMLAIRKILSSQLRLNMASGVALTIGNLSVVAISYPVYLHYLGFATYGLWLVLSVILAFANLAMLGIPNAMVKLVAEERGRNNSEGIAQYYTLAILTLFLSGSLVVMAVVVFRSPILKLLRIQGEYLAQAYRLLPYIALLSMYVFLVEATNATLSGLGRMDLANYLRCACRVAMIGVAIPFLSLGMGLESLLVAEAIGFVAMHIGSLICMHHIVPVHAIPISRLDRERFRALVRFGGGTLAISVVNMLLNPFNKIMLTRYIGLQSVPIYDLANKGCMEVRALLESGFRAMLPEISQLSAKTDANSRKRMVGLNRRAMYLILVAGLPMYVVLFVFAPPLLKIWLGARYQEIIPYIFRILLVGSFISLLNVPAWYALLGLGRVWKNFASAAIQSVTNVAIVFLTLILTSALSVSHIAYATVAGMTLATVYIVTEGRRAIHQHAPELVAPIVSPAVE